MHLHHRLLSLLCQHLHPTNCGSLSEEISNIPISCDKSITYFQMVVEHTYRPQIFVNKDHLFYNFSDLCGIAGTVAVFSLNRPAARNAMSRSLLNKVSWIIYMAFLQFEELVPWPGRGRWQRI